MQGVVKLISSAGTGLLLLIAGCGEMGNEPYAPRSELTWAEGWDGPVGGPLTLTTSDTVALASTHDSTLLSVLLVDTSLLQQAAGIEVTFEATLGSITTHAITDSSGIAYAWLRSAAENGISRVTAHADIRNRAVWDSLSVRFTGVHLSIVPVSAWTYVDSLVMTTITVCDGAGYRVPNAPLSLGGFLQTSAMTDSSGIYHAIAHGTYTGTITLIAQAGGVADTLLFPILEYVPSPNQY